MVKTILKFFLASLLVLILFLIGNTLLQKNAFPTVQTVQIKERYDSAAVHLSKAIQIKTISYGDTLPIDTAEFLQFRKFLETSYPLVHQHLKRQTFSEFSYLYTWTGKNSSLPPYVLMGHMDVVPVEKEAEKKWTVPSFSGSILKDTIWGRGSVDDKAAVIGILEAVEELLKTGYVPERTIYLSFGHDEEISGRRGAKTISEWFAANKIKPALVLDEGGQIDSQHFKSLKKPLAVIGTSEKGYVSLELTVEIPGGHSSMPPPETALDVLNKALVNLRSHQMPAALSPSILELINRTKSDESFLKKTVLSNLWLFKGAVISQLEKTKESNALVHTTLVPTILHSGIKDNVIPSVAKAIVNSRILPGETSDDVVAFVKKSIADERVNVVKVPSSIKEPTAVTPFDGTAFKELESVIYESVPDVYVSPYLMVGGTDSKYFRSVSNGVLNFAPFMDVKGFHGIDERLGISDLNRMINFYKALLKK
jgi:carboxypeptidase PM20D1